MEVFEDAVQLIIYARISLYDAGCCLEPCGDMLCVNCRLLVENGNGAVCLDMHHVLDLHHLRHDAHSSAHTIA